MIINPHQIFAEWIAEAKNIELNDPDAMALATATTDGKPSVRMVLLKGHDERGFVFYTNFNSRKGAELLDNPRAALMFHWKTLKRQVRIEGRVEPVSPEEADTYFATRTRDSNLSAIASNQSHPMQSRQAFENHFNDLRNQYEGQDIPRPPHWSGYRVVPDHIEFWINRPHRLHERQLFTAHHDGSWSAELLYP